MGKVDLIQGSGKWLYWRKDRLTASQIAQVMGVSPYGTAFTLWQEKTGRKEPPEFNDNMRFGQRMEPLIRNLWMEMSGESFMPACYQHPTIKHLGVSLDGINMNEDRIIELKACNRLVWDCLYHGSKVVEHYFMQIQLQLACIPSVQFCDAVFANGMKNEVREEHIAHTKIYPHIPTQEQIYEAAEKFMHNIKTDTPPEYTKKDLIYMGEDKTFADLEKKWVQASGELKVAKCREEEAKKMLLLSCNERNSVGDFVKILKVSRSGNIDWVKVTKQLGIADELLEKYRKKPSEYFKISLIS